MCIAPIVDLPEMYLWSKFEDSSPFVYLENELNTTGEYFASAHKSAHRGEDTRSVFCKSSCHQTSNYKSSRVDIGKKIQTVYIALGAV